MQHWLVGQLARCHTRKHLFLQDNAFSHTTFVAVVNMLVGLAIVPMHALICLAFQQFILLRFL